MFHFGLAGQIVDAAKDSLYGELEKSYTKSPPNMKDLGQYDRIILQKCIYGLVKPARQYNKKAVKILKKIGFTRGYVNPCLYLNQRERVQYALYCMSMAI